MRKLWFILLVLLFTSCGSIQINIASSVTTVVAPKLQYKSDDSEITGSDLKGNKLEQTGGEVKAQ